MTTLINLPDWVVLDVTQTTNDYRVSAGYTRFPERCPHCSGNDLFTGKLYKHGTREQTVMDLPAHGKRVGIVIDRPRYRCQDCGKTLLQPLPDVEEGGTMTKRLVAYVELESVQRTFVSVADEVGVSEKTVRNIFKEYVKRLDAETKLVTPEWLGIDEIYLLKKPRAIFTNLKERTVMGLLPDRNKATVSKFLSKLDEKAVKVVAMDMWKAFKDAVHVNLPKAVVVVDKFHVVRMANYGLEAVRKQVRKTLGEGQRRSLMHDRFVLLKRKHDLKPGQLLILEAILGSFPELDAAHKAKEGFYGVYDAVNKKAAWAAFLAWEESLTPALKTAFKELLTAMYNWKDQILAYFDNRATNALTEALNGLAKLVQRAGRGYSFPAIRAKLLYARQAQKRPAYGVEVQPEPGAEYSYPEIDATMAEPDEGPTLGTDIDILARVLGGGPEDLVDSTPEAESGHDE